MEDREKEEQHKMEHGRQDGRLKKIEGLRSTDGATQRTEPQSAKGTPKYSTVSPKTSSKFGALTKQTQIPTNGRTQREKGFVKTSLRGSEESNNNGTAKSQEDSDSRKNYSLPDAEVKTRNDFTSGSLQGAGLRSKAPCPLRIDPPPPVSAVADVSSIGVLKSLRVSDRSSSVPVISSPRIRSGPTPPQSPPPARTRPRHSFSELLRLSSTNLASVPELSSEDPAMEDPLLHQRQTAQAAAARRLSLSSQDVSIEWASTRGNPLSRITAGADRRLLVATSADRLSREGVSFVALSDSGQESLSVSDNSAEGVELGRIPPNADDEEDDDDEEELTVNSRKFSTLGGGRRNESVEIGDLWLSASCPALNADDDLRFSIDSFSSSSCESLVSIDSTRPPPPPPQLETSHSTLTRSSFNDGLEPRFLRHHSSSSELSSTETLQNAGRTGPSNRLQGWQGGRSLSMSTLHLRCSHEDDLDEMSMAGGAKQYGSFDQVFCDQGEFKVVHWKAPEPSGQRERWPKNTRTKQERESKTQHLIKSQDQGFRTSQVVGHALGNVPDVESEEGSSDISKTDFENDTKTEKTPVLTTPTTGFYDDPITLQSTAADLRYPPVEQKDKMLGCQQLPFEAATQIENESKEPATNGKVTRTKANGIEYGNSRTASAQDNRKDATELVHLHSEASKQNVRQSTVIILDVFESCDSVEQDRDVTVQMPVSGSADLHKEATMSDDDQEQENKAKSLLSAVETRLNGTKEETFIVNNSRKETEMLWQNDKTRVVISACEEEDEDHVEIDIQCPGTADAGENGDVTVNQPTNEKNSNVLEYFSTESDQETAAETDDDISQSEVLQQNQIEETLADDEIWERLWSARYNRRGEETFFGRKDIIEVIYEDEELVLGNSFSEVDGCEGIEYMKTREDEDELESDYCDESKSNINEEEDEYIRDWTASWIDRNRYSDNYSGLAKPSEIVTEPEEDSVDSENSRYPGTGDWSLQQRDHSAERPPTTDGPDDNNCGFDGEVDFISTESIFGDFDELSVSRDHWLWRRRDWQRCLSASELEYVDPLDWYEGRSLSSGCLLMPTTCVEPKRHAGSMDSITYFFLGGPEEGSCPSRRHSSASVYADAAAEGGPRETGTFENFVPGSSRRRRLSWPVCGLTPPSQPKAVEITIGQKFFPPSANGGCLSGSNALEEGSPSTPDWKNSGGERTLPIGSSGHLNRRLVKRTSLGSGRLDCRQTFVGNFKNRKVDPSGSYTEIPSTPESIAATKQHPLSSDNTPDLNAQTLSGRKLTRNIAVDSTTAPDGSHASTKDIVSTETSLKEANVTTRGPTSKKFHFSNPTLSNNFPLTKTAETQTYRETRVIEIQTSPNEISAQRHFAWTSTESVKSTPLDASAVPLYSDSRGTADDAESNRVPPSPTGSQDPVRKFAYDRSTTKDIYYDSMPIREDVTSEDKNWRSVNRFDEKVDQKRSYKTSSSNRENQPIQYRESIQSNDNTWRSDLTKPLGGKPPSSDDIPPTFTDHPRSPIIRPLRDSVVDDIIGSSCERSSPQFKALLHRSASGLYQRRDDIFSTDIRCDFPRLERSGKYFSMYADPFSFATHDIALNLCSFRCNEAARNETFDWENYSKYSHDNGKGRNRAKNRSSLTITDVGTNVNVRAENTVPTFDDNFLYKEPFGLSNNKRLSHKPTNNHREIQLEKKWRDNNGSGRRKEYSCRDLSSNAGTSVPSFPLIQTVGPSSLLYPSEFRSESHDPERRDPTREPNREQGTWKPFYDRLSQDFGGLREHFDSTAWTEKTNTLPNRRRSNELTSAFRSDTVVLRADDDEIGRLRRERRRLLRLLAADVNASKMRTEHVEAELRLQLRLTDRLLRSLSDDDDDDDDCRWII